MDVGYGADTSFLVLSASVVGRLVRAGNADAELLHPLLREPSQSLRLKQERAAHTWADCSLRAGLSQPGNGGGATRDTDIRVLAVLPQSGRDDPLAHGLREVWHRPS